MTISGGQILHKAGYPPCGSFCPSFSFTAIFRASEKGLQKPFFRKSTGI